MPAEALDRFHALPADQAINELMACCASRDWASRVAAARPYPSEADLLDQASELAERLEWTEILRALAAHPRIGERKAGDDRDARWSRQEQSGVSGDFEAANRAYEQKFGHVYLVCATGRGGEELREDLRERLDNDPDRERKVVARELSEIVKIRLRKLLS